MMIMKKIVFTFLCWLLIINVSWQYCENFRKLKQEELVANLSSIYLTYPFLYTIFLWEKMKLFVVIFCFKPLPSIIPFEHRSLWQMVLHLTLKAPITTAADNILNFFFFFSIFQRKQALIFHVNHLLGRSHTRSPGLSNMRVDSREIPLSVNRFHIISVLPGKSLQLLLCKAPGKIGLFWLMSKGQTMPNLHYLAHSWISLADTSKAKMQIKDFFFFSNENYLCISPIKHMLWVPVLIRSTSPRHFLGITLHCTLWDLGQESKRKVITSSIHIKQACFLQGL